jgi:hypothetical protein
VILKRDKELNVYLERERGDIEKKKEEGERDS